MSGENAGDATLREGLLFGMGNPLLDISACVDEDFLKKYELESNNAILASDHHMPMYEEITEKYDVEYIAGGSTQNSMKVAQWILGKPNIATFMGSIGKDKFGKILEEKAREAGVYTRYYYHNSAPTGTCAVLITKNGTNRSLVANLAAANLFVKDHLDEPENKKVMEKAEYFYIAGFFLTASPDSALEVAKHACEANKTFCMNLSAPFISEVFGDRLMKIFPYVDVLFGNETEAAAFAEQQHFGTSDMKEVALKISAMPKENQKRPRITVITQGKDEVIVAHDGQISTYPVKPLEESKIVDTNGAGDAFVGGFLAQLVQGKPIGTCVKCGNYAASVIIQNSGCTFPKNHDFQE